MAGFCPESLGPDTPCWPVAADEEPGHVAVRQGQQASLWRSVSPQVHKGLCYQRSQLAGAGQLWRLVLQVVRSRHFELGFFYS